MQAFSTHAPARATRRSAMLIAGLAISLGVQALVAGSAAAAPTGQYYVDTTGDDGAACSQVAPCATIDAAVTAAAASAQAVINVGPGTFGAATNPISTGTLTVAGIPGHTVVDGDSGNGFENGGASLTLTGLQITSFPVGVLTSSGTTNLVQVSVTGGATALSTTAGATTATGSTLSGSDYAANLAGGSLLVDQSTLTGAGASAIAAASGTTVTVNNSTIAENANGIAAVDATVTIGSSTIAENDANGLSGSGSQTTLFGSILADNGDGDCTNDAAAGLLDNGFNTDSDGTCALLEFQGSLSDVDPGLGGLADNGGLTQTESIGASSPARGLIPVASCPAVDQRGASRTGAGATFCDTGAFEYAAPTTLNFRSAPISGPTSAGANLGPVTVEQRDADGNPTSSGGPVTLHIASPTPNSTFAQTQGGTATSVVSIPAGATSASFFFGDSAPGTVVVNVSATGLASTTQSETVVTGSAASFTTTGGDQSAVTHQDFGSPLTALVLDGTGNPVAGAVVSFSSAGAGTAYFPVGLTAVDVPTDSSGVASTPLAAGGTAGAVTVTIGVAGVGPTQDLQETVTAGAAATVQATQGDAQTVVPHQMFSPLQVSVVDADSNPIVGATVTFAVTPLGAATFAGGTITAVTDSGGLATAPDLTAGALPRTFTVVASVPGGATSATFTETITNGSAATTVITAGNAQTIAAHLAFPIPLAVRVTDADGNVVPNESVTFTVSPAGFAAFPGSSASVVVLTGANGVATAPTLTAGSTSGFFAVTATVAGTPAVTFTERVTVGPRPVVLGISPNNSSASGGRALIIRGTGFSGTTVVHFGTAVVMPAQFTRVATSTLIYLKSPAHSPGGVDVTVTAAGGISAVTTKDRFYYLR